MSLPQPPPIEIHSLVFEIAGGEELVHVQFSLAQEQSRRRGMMRRMTVPTDRHAEKIREILQAIVELIDDGDVDHRDPPARVPLT